MNDIKVNDLVIAIKPPACGCASKSMGVPFVVFGIEKIGRCAYCGARSAAVDTATSADDAHRVQLWRLIKIDPPAIDTAAETELELTL